MTKPEFEQFVKLVLGLWPRWTTTTERMEALWGMFGPYEAAAVAQAARRVFHEDPDAIKPELKKIRVYLQSAGRHNQLAAREQKLLEEHREHYKGWAHKGWVYPGDGVILHLIRSGKMTPLQRHTLREMAAAIKAGLAKSPITELAPEGEDPFAARKGEDLF